MSRGMHRVHRSLRIVPILALLLTGVTPFALDQSIATAQDGPALVVDDAATANPELVEVEVADPADFNVSGTTLQVPPGYSVSVVAASLKKQHFIHVDTE